MLNLSEETGKQISIFISQHWGGACAVYPALTIICLLKTWRRKELGILQQFCLPFFSKYSRLSAKIVNFDFFLLSSYAPVMSLMTKKDFLLRHYHICKICNCFISSFMAQNKTRTTFETPKYHRRPRDQYTPQIVNTLALSGPHQIEFKKTLSNLVKFQTTNTCTYVAAKNARIVKQSHCETV